MPGVEVPMPSWMMAAVETRVPEWATATIVYRDEAGRICGYGYSEREAGTFSVSTCPLAVRLLASSPPEEGE
jgi:hypothetical protein